MSLLSSGLIRNGGISFWNTPCCRDVLKAVSVAAADEQAYALNRTACLDRPKSKPCKKCAPSVLTLFTQVRFHDEGERGPFHRDIDFPNFDAYRKNEFKDVRTTKWGQGDDKPGRTYFLGFFALVVTAYGVKSHVTHYISVMAPAADVLAMSTIEVDISNVGPGQCTVVKWRGKPLMIKSRTAAEIDAEEKTPMSVLKDPQTQDQRTQKPEWLVVIGICTHLGCVPVPNTGDFLGGFYCPCHGSHYDNMGRARKGPAPLNMEIPPYKFVSDTVIFVG